MNNALEKLYNLKGDGMLSPNDCALINKELASLSINDIPCEQYRNIEDYLTSALNMGSVESDLVEELDTTLKKLQELI